MALGRIAVKEIASANTNETLWDATAVASADLTVVNPNSADATIRVAIINGAIGALANEDYVYYDMLVPGTASAAGGSANTIPLLSKEAISADELVMVRASATGVVFRLSGRVA